ncbi:MAG TPA: CBS domain-containing protein [Epsilonproteobacteria bacterium]|nr:CBS domain-containing protein [Campylobacterota bacterium]
MERYTHEQGCHSCTDTQYSQKNLPGYYHKCARHRVYYVSKGVKMTALSSIAHTEGFAIEYDATISETMECMLSNGNGVAVLLKEKRPLAIVTESLLLAHMEALDYNAEVIDLSSRPVITAHKARPVESAFDLVVTNNIRRLVLVDDEGLYCGIVLQEDLFDFLEEDVYKVDLKVADLLSSDAQVITVDEDATLHDALFVMCDKHIGSVVIADSQEKFMLLICKQTAWDSIGMNILT